LASNLSEQQILDAAAQVNAAGIASVADPADQPWTHILCWDGNKLDPPESGRARS